MKTAKKAVTLSEQRVKDLAETMVETAIRTQARELEKHLKDIDRRLRELERRSK